MAMPATPQDELPQPGPAPADFSQAPAEPAAAGQPTLPAAADAGIAQELQEAREAVARAEKAQKEAEAKAQENWDLFLRTRADLENYRKRMERDIAAMVQRGKRELLFNLLDVIDNFERALAASTAATSGNAGGTSVVEGFRIILRQIEGILARHGVERMQVLGQPFDPARHEAVAVWDVPGLEREQVTDEVRAGYTIDGEVLRAAQVRVGRPAPPEGGTPSV